MEYRTLNESEIARLSAAGCTAADWTKVRVAWGGKSYTDRIRNTRFSGDNYLGSFEGKFPLPGGFDCASGLNNAVLHNVTVGNDCLINNIGQYIANYRIGDGCLIDNVDLLLVDGRSSFGNGLEVSVLNETGGREVVITDILSTHVAYIMALYRHRPELHVKLSEIAKAYAKTKEADFGTIGNKVEICNSGVIRNVRVGECCRIFGTRSLSNGSINSTASDPVLIGSGVIAKDFIISSGARIEDNAMIDKCFIGQCCRLGHGYTASESLFFSNCQGENGEACAIFAGPFTVSHHKSSLLIAGMFSFMNAGSGSNQSNHMYKLGPIHQGILERGAKTASDSYILWPSRVGAFSLVMGRHVTHSDTSNLPFSYLIEQNNTTYLVPGVNLRSVGTIRDAKKWPKRDARKGPDKLDCINYNLLSPYTIKKMFKGLQTLENLKHSSGELSDIYSFHSTKITNHALHKGIEYYNTGITKFLGNSLIKRLENLPKGASEEEMHKMLMPDTAIGSGDWVDIGGLIAPKSEVNGLLDRIESGEITTLGQINGEIVRMHENYYTYEWTWAFDKIREYFGTDPAQLTKAQVIDIVTKWRNAVVGLDHEVYEDAKKEFSLSSMTGFGADGSRREKEQDFENVRGDFESNPFVNEVLAHIRKKTDLGNELIERLS